MGTLMITAVVVAPDDSSLTVGKLIRPELGQLARIDNPCGSRGWRGWQSAIFTKSILFGLCAVGELGWMRMDAVVACWSLPRLGIAVLLEVVTAVKDVCGDTGVRGRAVGQVDLVQEHDDGAVRVGVQRLAGADFVQRNLQGSVSEGASTEEGRAYWCAPASTLQHSNRRHEESVR